MAEQGSHRGMGERGLTRPTPLLDEGGPSEDEGDGAKSRARDDASTHEGMRPTERTRALTQHHEKTLWGLWTNVLFGLGLAALALRRGPKTERNGAWDRYVR